VKNYQPGQEVTVPRPGGGSWKFKPVEEKS
jgi:hypothetical protein